MSTAATGATGTPVRVPTPPGFPAIPTTSPEARP